MLNLFLSPEGASVTVITRDADETFEVDEATERMLLDAIAQCENGGTVPLGKVLSDFATTIERIPSDRRQPARGRADSHRE
jgi:hypothetical protein